MRTILHIDMDCFYAAIEMRERPELAQLPVAVGGSSVRGVLCTANYEARKYGVRSAMSGFDALHRCPRLVVLPVRFDLYRRESARIRKILRHYTPLVEPLSLDEAYLDVTGCEDAGPILANRIREHIFRETGLPASAGIAPNKLLAKIASDWRKPNGQYCVRPENLDTFVKQLPVRKIWGVGPKTAERFEAAGFHTCGELQQIPLSDLVRQHGRFGAELYQLCRGIDHREVNPSRDRKSMSSENTFKQDLQTYQDCEEALAPIFDAFMNDLRQFLTREERTIRSAFVKVKFNDFQRTTAEGPPNDLDFPRFRELLIDAYHRRELPVRLLGLGVRFDEPSKPQQLELLP